MEETRNGGNCCHMRKLLPRGGNETVIWRKYEPGWNSFIAWSIIPSARGLRVHGFTRDSKYWHCCRIQVCLVPGCFPIIFNCFVNLYKNEPVSFSIVAFPSISRTATKEGTVFATHSALSPNTKARAKLLPKASERPTRKPRRVYADFWAQFYGSNY